MKCSQYDGIHFSNQLWDTAISLFVIASEPNIYPYIWTVMPHACVIQYQYQYVGVVASHP